MRVNYKKIIILTGCFFILLIGISLYFSKYGLCVKRYSFTADIKERMRIVLISDLHSNEFGHDNSNLIGRIQDENPDLILLCGDIVNNDASLSEINEACFLIKNLRKFAPVYFSYGNHEKDWEKMHKEESIERFFSTAGAIVLDSSWKDIKINSNLIRIGGIYGKCLPDKYIGEYDEDEALFLRKMALTDRYTILLSHLPVCWLVGGGLDFWNINLVMAGHIHGGQIRFPFIGGLYAPDLGMFPGKIRGVYHAENGENRMVLTSGLGSYDILPRLNNIPEIVVLEISPK